VNAATTCLVVLARAPEAGRGKTRLAVAIGEAQALQVYRRLLAITADAALAWPGPRLLASAGDPAAFAGTRLDRLPRVDQAEGGLGVVIAAALAVGLGRARAVLVIGSDCPGLCESALAAVADVLTAAPVAFGPADDGGFWAIATRDHRAAELVATLPVPWSTRATLTTLRSGLAAAGLPSALGPTLGDVDTAADLDAAIAAGVLPPLPPQAGGR